MRLKSLFPTAVVLAFGASLASCGGGSSNADSAVLDGQIHDAQLDGTADANSHEDTGVPDDSSSRSDGAIPDDASVPGDASVEAGPIDRPPRAECTPTAAAFPNALAVSSSATDPDGDVIDAFSWRLSGVPGGSAYTFVDPAVPAFQLTPDVAGYYDLCVTATSKGLSSTESCCRYSAAAGPEWTFVLERSSRYLEEIVLMDGHIEFSFDTNQVFELVSSTITTSDAGWSVSSGGGAYSVGRLSVQAQVHKPTSDLNAITVGDEVSASVTVNPYTTGPANTVVTASFVLESMPDPGPMTPQIAAFATGSVFADVPARMSVQFASGRPVGERLYVGGWRPGAFVYLADDGTGADLVANDGWYSGLYTFADSGAQDLMIQPMTESTAGPIYSTTVVVP